LAELQLLVDDVVIKSFPFNKDTISIGRSPDNDIVIDEESVSSEHARIDLIPSQLMEGLIDVFIEDLGSTNGTFVNQVPVKRQQLQNFDYIRIAFTDFKLVADKTAKLARTTVILPDS
jgi:pSer/pThr/pTyr-binding forkhead associated (FHA) protein